MKPDTKGAAARLRPLFPNPVTVHDTEIAALLAAHHGLHPRRIQTLDSEAAAVRRIECDRGVFTVKLVSAQRRGAAQAVAWQAAYAAHLREQGLPAVHPLPDRAGRLVTPVADPRHGPLLMQLLTWCEAPSLLKLCEEKPEWAERAPQLVARLVGRVVAASADAPPAPFDFGHPWDARSALETARECGAALRGRELMPDSALGFSTGPAGGDHPACAAGPGCAAARLGGPSRSASRQHPLSSRVGSLPASLISGTPCPAGESPSSPSPARICCGERPIRAGCCSA